MKQRNSNFELMRIISMLFIVIGHTLSWGGITNKVDDGVKIFIYLIYAIIVVHVNSFILLTGYYQSKSKFKVSKVVKLICLMVFYRVFFYIIAVFFGWISWNGKGNFLFNLLPLSNFSYWFLNIYIILYVISPFLNLFIKKIKKNNYIILLIILFIFCSVLPRITLEEFFDNSGGYSLMQFIFMYLIGAFIKKYENDSYIDLFEKRIVFRNKIFGFLMLFFTFALTKFVLNFIGYKLSFSGGLLGSIGNIMKYSFDCLVYDDPLVVGQSICYFLFFRGLKIRSNVINCFGKVTNEIYLFHMNRSIRPTLYLLFGLSLDYYTICYVPIAIIISICIFMIGFVLYYFRIYLIRLILKIKFIFNFVSKINMKFEYIDSKINV